MSGAANSTTIVDMYSPIASDYEEIWAPLLHDHGLRLLDRMDLRSAIRVLDLGCGVGTLLGDIAERAPDATVVGVDLTHDMLRRAPAGSSLAAMDAMRLGFVQGAFDAVVSCFMVFHLPDPRSALSNLRDCISHGGAFGITVWGESGGFPAGDTWSDEMDRLDVPPDPAASGPPDGERFVNSPERLAATLDGAGFSTVRTESASWSKEWSVEAFVDWRRRMGPSRRRLDLLDEAERKRVIAACRKRVEGLSPQGLTDHARVVMGWASA